MPTASFIWGCFEATSKLKLVIVYIVCAGTAAASAGLLPPPPPHGWLKH